MFKSSEFTASGRSYIKSQGSAGKTFNSRVDIDQKFKLFVASSEEEMLEHLEELGIEAHRKNFGSQLRFNLITACRTSEEEGAGLGIFINLERYNGKLPTFNFIEVVGSAIATNFQKMKIFGEGTVRNELVMSLLSSAYEQCFTNLSELDVYCLGEEAEKKEGE